MKQLFSLMNDSGYSVLHVHILTSFLASHFFYDFATYRN